MASVSAPRTLARKPIYIFHPKKIPVKVTVTRLEDKVPVLVVNLWFLKPILAKVTVVIVVAAPATIRTTGRRMTSAMNGIHRVPVHTASFSNTTKRNGRPNVFVTQALVLSSGTRQTVATGFTPRAPAPIMHGSSLLETFQKYTVSVEMDTTLPPRSMSVREPNCWSCRDTCPS